MYKYYKRLNGDRGIKIEIFKVGNNNNICYENLRMLKLLSGEIEVMIGQNEYDYFFPISEWKGCIGITEEEYKETKLEIASLLMCNNFELLEFYNKVGRK